MDKHAHHVRIGLTAIIIATLLLLGAACAKDTPAGNRTNTALKNSESNQPADETATNTNVTTRQKPESIRAGTAIVVTSLKPNQELPSPFTVEGTTSGDTVYVRVTSDNGSQFINTRTSVNGGTFKITLSVSVGSSTSGTVEVFQKNERNEETNLVLIPVQFKKTSGTSTRVQTNVSTNASVTTSINTSVHTRSPGTNVNVDIDEDDDY